MESAKSSASGPEEDQISIQTETLSKLVCPLCFEYMKPPIYECDKGHAICEYCYELLAECPQCKSETYRRSSNLETLTGLVLFPCKKCQKKFSLDDLEQHKCVEIEGTPCETLCIFGQVYGECTWRGFAKDVVDHCSSQHANNYWTKKENTTKWKYCHLSNIGIQNMFVIDLTEAVFILVQKFDSNTQSLIWNISCECEKASDQYVFEIQLYSDFKLETLRSRNVIENGDNILVALPDSNEIVLPVAKAMDFLVDDVINYKVILHKKSDIQNDVNVKYYQVFSETENQMDLSRNDVKPTCAQKTWYSVVDFYGYIKKRLGCA